MSELQLLKVEFPAPEGSPHPTNGIKSYTNISWKSPINICVATAKRVVLNEKTYE